MGQKMKANRPRCRKRDNIASLTLEQIDHISSDLRFLRSVLDLISDITASGSDRPDELPAGSIYAVCSEALNKSDNLIQFIDELPSSQV